MEAPQRFLDLFDPETTPNQVEYAFSSVIDEGIKNVTTALKAKAMWSNALLVVSSDNGGPSFSDQHAASNWPLRGTCTSVPAHTQGLCTSRPSGL